MNHSSAASSIPAREVPLEALKVAKDELEREEAIEDEENQNEYDGEGWSSSSGDLKNSSSDPTALSRGRGSPDAHGKEPGMDDDEQPPRDGGVLGLHRSRDEGEIVQSPQERTGRDIRFGDLPNPRTIRHERRRSSSTPIAWRSADKVSPPVAGVDDIEDGMGRQTLTLENTPSHGRRDSGLQPRLRNAASTGFQRAATFESVLSNAFRRRRRDSVDSRRTSNTQMTLPYFTFQPTIGRNSVSHHPLQLIYSDNVDGSFLWD